MGKIFLKKGKEKILHTRNSWLYTGAVGKRENVEVGDIVEVYTADGKFAAYGFYYGGKNIEAYLFDFAGIKKDVASANYWLQRFKNAYALRQKYILPVTDAYRLIHSEGDGVPGLTVDIYAGNAVTDFKIAATENLASIFSEVLAEMGFNSAFVKSDVSGNYAGKSLFGNVPEKVLIREYENKFEVDIINGQKTGFFIDQRENRKLLQKFSGDKTVINLFSYTGGFSVYALRGGAKEVWSVDISEPALQIANNNISLNGFDDSRHIVMNENAFDVLHRMETGTFDIIVLDPPAFAKKDKDVKNAVRAYREINSKAIEKIKPGGIIFTFSCSQKIDRELFGKIVYSAAAKTGRQVRILHRLTQSPDHPVDIYQPKSEYLKGLVLEVT